MTKTNVPRVSREVRKILNQTLDSHAEAHLRHNLMAIGESGRPDNRVGKYRISENLPTYVVKLVDAARSGAKDPDRSGSVLLVEWPNKLLAKVELHDKNGHPALTRVSTGTLVSDLKDQIARIRGSGTSRNSEIRILAVPGIHLLCLWKHRPRATDEDSFVPVMVNFSGLQKGRSYSRTRVSKVARDAATRLILAWYERQAAQS